MNVYEILGVVSGVIAVWLTVRQNIWCWPIGLLNVGLFVIVFWQAKLYSDMGLQVVYIVLCLYGWWAWLHGGSGADGRLEVTHVPLTTLVVLLAGGAVVALGMGYALHRTTDAALPYLDATLTAFSLVAQWMQARKWLENWWLWIAVDVVYVGMYVVKGLYPTAGLYALFVALAARGLVEWRRSLPRPGEMVVA